MYGDVSITLSSVRIAYRLGDEGMSGQAERFLGHIPPRRAMRQSGNVPSVPLLLQAAPKRDLLNWFSDAKNLSKWRSPKSLR
jgi:hypothetical protein